MVLASSIEIQQYEQASETIQSQSPVISIIVPVYNGSKNIELTLQKIKSQIENLEQFISKLKASEKTPIFTGRKVVENASSAILLDKYLTTQTSDIASESDNERNSSTHLSLKPTWYEIVVVNDGSKDNTRNIVDLIASTDSTIRLISYSINMGKGYAIKQGVLHSNGKYVIFIDGDGEISTEVLANYLEKMSNADIVIASKYHPLSIVSVPTSRKFFSKCFQLLVKIILGVKVSDTQVGLKAGKGDLFRKIFQRVLVKRYAFDAEMLAVASLLGLRVIELPVKIELDKSFKKKEIVKMALDVLGVAYRLRLIKWYQKNMEKQRPSYRASMFALSI